jgi:hypothetical protein
VKKNSKFLQQVNILHKKERKKERNKRVHLCVYGKVGKCSKATAQSKTGLGNLVPARIKLGIF